MIRRLKPPKHRRTRNELRKTAPNAVHVQRPAGTKFAMRILKRTMSKEKALTRLGLGNNLVTGEVDEVKSQAVLG